MCTFNCLHVQVTNTYRRQQWNIDYMYIGTASMLFTTIRRKRKESSGKVLLWAQHLGSPSFKFLWLTMSQTLFFSDGCISAVCQRTRLSITKSCNIVFISTEVLCVCPKISSIYSNQEWCSLWQTQSRFDRYNIL